uniref:Uncharacterized protein n=2 Tax=Oryza punctata TaxID=4537 RepID=A0A0E0L137_ORYPU
MHIDRPSGGGGRRGMVRFVAVVGASREWKWTSIFVAVVSEVSGDEQFDLCQPWFSPAARCWKHSHLIWLGSTGLLRIYDPGTSTEWKQTSG